jgi:ABC-type oligopeptide transport system substrate-binding subunit
VLHDVAASHPLLLILDDLQWADTASLSLLFHLGRRLAGCRVLIGCAYRSEEVALGRDGQRHPLERILAELKRTFGDVWIDLGHVDKLEARGFVDEVLETQPNRLGEGFRRSLFERTEGHPLFTVELLRALQERGDLVQDEDGRWVEGGALDWGPLPARVEAVIEERVGRLGGELGEILAAASVQGEEFAAQVVAGVCGIRERDVIRKLGWALDKRHRLVVERGSGQVGPRRLHLYRFRHSLFQQHVYGELGEIERRLLHGDVGSVLEELYGEQTEEITSQLAWHFSQAGEVDKAIDYLLLAGDRSRFLNAGQEAIAHYQQALALLKESEDYERAGQTLMKLGLAQHLSFDFRSSSQAYRGASALRKKAGASLTASSGRPAPHALRVNWGDPLTLDPAMISDIGSVAVVDQLFSGLLALGEEMEIGPYVAHRWDVAEGGRKYVFHLRDDVGWSDGTPVTARDFEYAWKRFLHPATGAPLANLLYDIKGARPFQQGECTDPGSVGVRALDRTTLAVELERPTGHFLNLLAHNSTYPVPRHVVEAHGDAWTDVDTIVTNGPFRLEVRVPGESLVLARNPMYHGPFPSNLQRVAFCLLADPHAHVDMYDAGRLDILDLHRLPPADALRARQRHPGEYLPTPALFTYYLAFDASRPPFDDPRVRRALVLAIDREALAGVALGYGFSPATGGVVPPGMPGHSEGISLPHDAEGARRSLSEAGYPGGRGFPSVELLVLEHQSSIVQVLAAEWRANLGVETCCVTQEGKELLARVASDPPPIFGLGWRCEYPDPDNFLRVAPIRRYTRWYNQAYDRLLEQAARCTDQGERMRLYGQADRILIDEAVIMPYAYGRFDLLVKPWVRGLPTAATRYWFWKNVILEPH